MITGNVTKNQSPEKKSFKKPSRWQTLLSEAVRDPLELLQLLNLQPENAMPADFNPEHFPLRVPRGFIAKMQKNNWQDPLLRQVLPLDAEQRISPGFQLDPVNDLHATQGKGMLQKYHGRALIITTGACAIHCRYCFRQHFPYHSNSANPAEWQALVSKLDANPSISEVILSGGDPLTLSDARLAALCQQITDIPHIHTLRIHSRLPLVLPERIDASFLHWFSALDIHKVVVIHANHAQEFCSKTSQVLNKLRQNGALLLNQSVLLKGINDSVTSLVELSQTLHANQVLPYYLHMLDQVQGAAHYAVTEQHALQLMQEIRNQLPGYLVPRLVREVSGKRSKSPII